MEINKDIQTAINVTYRYAVLHESAKAAGNALNVFKFDVFTDMLSKEEMEILRKAQEICGNVSSMTGQYDVQKYLKKLEHETVNY